MVDKASGQDFTASINSLDGSGGSYSANLPPYVLDKTVRDVMEGLVTAISDSDTENTKGLKDLAKLYKQSLDTQKESKESNEQGLEELNETMTEAEKLAKQRQEELIKSLNQQKADREKYEQKIGEEFARGATKGGRFAGDLIVSAIKGIAVVFGTSVGIVGSAFSNLGNSLRTLTDTGQAFGDQLGTGNNATEQNIILLNRMGLTTEQAVASLETYSRAMSTLGQTNLAQLSRSFLELTRGGTDLGVTLEEATELFLQDQEFRARTLNKDKIDTSITAQLTQQSIQNLRGFSAILGQSTDALRQTAASVMESNKSFIGFTNSLNTPNATTLNTVAKDLVAGLVAVFPESGEALGDALLTVSGTGVSAISDFANMLIPLGGNLNGAFQDLARDLRSGSLGVEDVPNAIQDLVNAADLNKEQLEQLSVIAGLQGHPMQETASIIITMQQEASAARDRLQKLASSTGLQISEVQKISTGFDNIIKSVRGGYSGLLNSIPLEMSREMGSSFDALYNVFVGKEGGVSVLNSALSRAGSDIGAALANTLKELAPDGDYGKLINSIVTNLVKLTTYIIGKVQNIISALSKDGELDIGGAISSFIGEFIGLFFEGVWMALTNAPWSVLIPITAILGSFLVVTSAITGFFQAAAFAAGQAFVAAAAMSRGGGFVGPMPGGKGKGFLRSAGSMAARATPYLAGAMVLKDGFDVVAGTDGGATGSNIGGLTGGLGGAALGAAIGSIIPGIGTLIGAGIGAAVGNLAGGAIGSRRDKEKTENSQRVANITSPNLAGPTSDSLNVRYLDQMTNPNGNSSSLSVSEINKLDKESPETKALTLILAENKRLNRQITEIITTGLKTKTVV